MADRRLSGDRGEDAALGYLERHGLRLACRNYSCRRGEIDLIMRDRQELVFVEVRYRAQKAYVNAAESIDAKKRQRLQATALHYLQSHGLNPNSTPLRFDVIALGGTAPHYTTNWIRNAIN